MIAAHLWQSTVFVGVVWLATLALRHNRARVRYWLWVAASLKFVVPFSWLVTLGAQFEWRSGSARIQPAAAFVIDQMWVPTRLDVAPVAAAPGPAMLPAIVTAIWLAGAMVVCFWWWRQWLPVRAARRAATRLSLDASAARGLIVMSSPMSMEPGVVGVWRPVLLVPDGLLDLLTPEQVGALVAHERSHVRHRDNLMAVAHMAVEALFWFHPLVWWIERRLIDERERRCDEDVLRSGTEPADYAAGILAVCRHSAPAPLACVAGVTGADLRHRIESILRGTVGRPLGATRRWALATTAVAAIAVPLAAGAVNAVPLISVGQDPTAPVAFDVASVKVNKSGDRPANTNDSVPGVFTATNAWLQLLIRYAYEVQDNQIVDAPDWIRTLAPERFDVAARLGQVPPGLSDERAKRLAMRTLLAERFNLVVRRETRDAPMWALVMARRDGQPGPGLKRSATDCSPEAREARIASIKAGAPPGICGLRVNTGRIQFGGYPLSWFATYFSPYDGRSVIDRTGLTGNWEFVLTFQPDQPGPPPGENPPPIDPDAPPLPTALQEQLGLRLEPTRGTIEVLVVERVERPTEN